MAIRAIQPTELHTTCHSVRSSSIPVGKAFRRWYMVVDVGVGITTLVQLASVHPGRDVHDNFLSDVPRTEIFDRSTLPLADDE